MAPPKEQSEPTDLKKQETDAESRTASELSYSKLFDVVVSETKQFMQKLATAAKDAGGSSASESTPGADTKPAGVKPAAEAKKEAGSNTSPKAESTSTHGEEAEPAASADAGKPAASPDQKLEKLHQFLHQALKDMGLSEENKDNKQAQQLYDLAGVIEAIAEGQEEFYAELEQKQKDPDWKPSEGELAEIASHSQHPRLKESQDGKVHFTMKTPALGNWKEQNVEFTVSKGLMPDGKTVDPKAFVIHTDDFNGKPLAIATKVLDDKKMRVWLTRPGGEEISLNSMLALASGEGTDDKSTTASTGSKDATAKMKIGETVSFVINNRDKDTVAVEKIEGLSMTVMGLPVKPVELRYSNTGPLGATCELAAFGKPKLIDVSVTPAGDGPMKAEVRLGNSPPIKLEGRFLDGGSIEIKSPSLLGKPAEVVVTPGDDGSYGLKAKLGDIPPINARLREKDGWAMINVEEIDLLGKRQPLEAAVKKGRDGYTYAHFYNLLGSEADIKAVTRGNKVHVEASSPAGMAMFLGQSQGRITVGSAHLNKRDSFDVVQAGNKMIIDNMHGLWIDAHFQRILFPNRTIDRNVNIKKMGIAANGTATVHYRIVKPRLRGDKEGKERTQTIPLPSEFRQMLAVLLSE